MSQQSLFVDYARSTEPWPAYGMMLAGAFYVLPPWGQTIVEPECGFLPTIGKNETKGSSKKRYLGSSDFRGAKMSEGLRHRYEDPIYTHPDFAEVIMGYRLGSSALSALATVWFRSKREKHSKG